MLWNSYRYRIEDGEAILEEYCGDEVVVHIPAQIEGIPVTEVGPEAFSSHGALIEEIEVPGSVRSIGDGAFKMCMSLEKLILQDGVCSIGENVLLVTAVTQMYLPASVTELKRPWEWGKIALEIDPDNPRYFSDGYGLYERREDGWILLTVRAEDSREIYEVVSGTKYIGTHAFEGQMYIQKVVLPEGLVQIGEEAFESCQALRQIVLQDGLKEIASDAFRCCIRLERLDLPASLEIVGEDAVTDTYGWSPSMNGIQYMTVHPDNPYFYHDANAFYRKTAQGSILIKYFGKNETWHIPHGVTAIGAMAFRRSNLKEVSIPEDVHRIEKDAFSECGRLECMELEADQVQIYVPANPVYRKSEISSLFYQGTDGQLQYDYDAYDALLQEWSQILIRCRMAAFRLEYPVRLSEERKEQYRTLIQEHLEELVTDICTRDSLEDLEALGRAGMISADSVEKMIDWTTQQHRGRLTGYLMEYQSRHFGNTEFDFSL